MVQRAGAAWTARAAPAGAFLLLAALFCWPVALHPGGEYLAARYDAPGVLWGGAWFSGRFPMADGLFFSRMLGYPFGVSLAHFDSWVWAAWASATVPLAGVTAAFNLFAILAVAASGLLQYRLCRRQGCSVPASLAGGVVLSISASNANLALEGAAYLLFVGCLPLYAHCLLDAMERPSWRGPLNLGLAFALATYTSGYYGLLCLLATPFLVVPRLLMRRLGLRGLGRLAAGGVVAGLVLAPLLALSLSVRHTSTSAQYQGDLPSEIPREEFYTAVSVPVESLYRPRQPRMPSLVTSLYPGYAALALALAALLWLPGRRTAVWAAMALFFFLTALGPEPTLTYAGLIEPPDATGLQRLHPGFWLFKLPGLSKFRFPTRLAFFGLSALGVLAALGLDRLHGAGRGPRWTALLLGAALLGESLLVAARPLPRPTRPLDLPPALQTLASDPAPGAVLHIASPLPHHGQVIVAWQVLHRRPVTYEGHFKVLFPNQMQFARLLWLRLGHEVSGGRWGLSRPELLGLLRRAGFRYVVLHERDANRALRNDRAEARTLLSGVHARWLGPDPVGLLKALMTRELSRVGDTPGELSLFRVPGKVTPPERVRPSLTPAQTWRVWHGELLGVLDEVLPR